MASNPEMQCSGCGSKAVDYSDIGESGLPYCDECRLIDEVQECLEEVPELFAAALAELAAPFRSWADGIVEQLIQEAWDAASRGDFDEARHRLRLAAKPKFKSEPECAVAYAAAMAEKRGASV